MSNNQLKKTGTAKQIFLLGLPYLLTFFAIVCFSYCGLSIARSALENSYLVGLFNAPGLNGGEDDSELEQVQLSGDLLPISALPKMTWGDRWATLAVDELPDASINGAKVYVGDSNDILKKGVGKYYGSRFCGEGGKIVLSAHVTQAFRCLEDMQVGYTVRVNTIYGEYVYRVEEIFLFEPTDDHIIRDSTETEQLLLYTCYPRAVSYRRQRIGVRCSKVSGADFR